MSFLAKGRGGKWKGETMKNERLVYNCGIILLSPITTIIRPHDTTPEDKEEDDCDEMEIIVWYICLFQRYAKYLYFGKLPLQMIFRVILLFMYSKQHSVACIGRCEKLNSNWKQTSDKSSVKINYILKEGCYQILEWFRNSNWNNIIQLNQHIDWITFRYNYSREWSCAFLGNLKPKSSWRWLFWTQ